MLVEGCMIVVLKKQIIPLPTRVLYGLGALVVGKERSRQRFSGKISPEDLRSYAVYGGTGALGIILLWLLVDGWHMPIWLAQGIVILFTVVVSYLGHARFTFRRSRSGTQ